MYMYTYIYINTIGGTSSPKALKTAVYVGLVQNVLSKATKYAIFDPTKVYLCAFEYICIYVNAVYMYCI
jgi:ATP/ADP translocase